MRRWILSFLSFLLSINLSVNSQLNGNADAGADVSFSLMEFPLKFIADANSFEIRSFFIFSLLAVSI